MSDIGRAFVAVVPPPEVLDAVEHRVAALRGGAPRLRWTPRSQWHLTVRFLGRVDDAGSLVAALGDVGAATAPFPVQLAGGGAFPEARRASVLWLGVGDGHAALRDLSVEVRAATDDHCAAVDDRPFHPHVTVARARRPARVDGLVEGIGDGAVGPGWEVGELVVFESETRSEGAVHHALERVSLRGADDPNR